MEQIKQKIILTYNSTIDLFGDSFDRLIANEGFLRYFKNTGWLFLGRMTSIIVFFFVGVYVARYLGPTQYGLLNYVVSFVGLFIIFASFGIDNILSRELIKTPEKRDELLGSGFIIKIIGSTLAIILIVITLLLLKQEYLTNLLILLYSISFFFYSFGVIDIYFQANVLAQKTVKIQLVSLVITNILKLILIYYKVSLLWFVIISLLDVTILAIGFVLSYKKMGLNISKWKINYSIIKMLIENSWPLILSGVAISIYMKIDQVMITNMIGTTANGIYSVAVKMSEVWYYIPIIICTSLFPAIVNAKKTNELIYEKRLTKLYSLMIYLSMSIAILVSIFSNIIVSTLFGNDYIGAVKVLQIHIWAGIGIFLGYATTQYLIAENYTKIFFAVTLLGAISNVILNLVLIPKYGIIGSAWATLIAYSIATFSIVLFRKSRRQVLLMLKSLNIFNY
jgi:O-antigen/teichoic acid export membrane protein